MEFNYLWWRKWKKIKNPKFFCQIHNMWSNLMTSKDISCYFWRKDISFDFFSLFSFLWSEEVKICNNLSECIFHCQRGCISTNFWPLNNFYFMKKIGLCSAILRYGYPTCAQNFTSKMANNGASNLLKFFCPKILFWT